MRAFVHEGKPGLEGTRIMDLAPQEPGPQEVKVKVMTAGLNHRDLFVLHRHKENAPLVIGSDAAGIVAEAGADVTHLKEGDEVVLNPGIGWQEESEAPPEGFQIVGLPGHGTFAEYVTVPAANLELKPPHLTWEEAGVFSLIGLTAYRALITRAKLQPSHTLLLPGAGSGAVTFMILIAKKIGARVIVTSRSEEKRQKALELGADLAIDSEDDWDEQMNGEKVDIAVDTVGAATFQKSLDQLKKGGTIVIFGASAGDEVTLNLRSFFYGQYNLLGSTLGSHEEYQEMIAFISKHNMHPPLDKTYSLEAAGEALRYLDDGAQFGKIALQVGDIKEME